MVVGFDVSKASTNWALVNGIGKVLAEGKCNNTERAVATVLVPIRGKYSRLRCAVEATGIYHLPVLRACEVQGIPCRQLNPIQTKQFTRTTVRAAKTDRKDAVYVALLGLRGAGYTVLPVDDALMAAKTYLRLADRLRDAGHSMLFMQQYLHDNGQGLSEDSLTACRIQLLAAVQDYRGRAAKALDASRPVALLQSIPGLGPVLAMGIVAEIGNLGRFHNAPQLVAYAGLDPRIKQSGPMHSTGRLTKRGSPFLRQRLHVASMGVQRYDPELKAVHERQRARGKSYTAATVCVSRKLVHRIFSVLKRDAPYEVRSLDAAPKNT